MRPAPIFSLSLAVVAATTLHNAPAQGVEPVTASALQGTAANSASSNFTDETQSTPLHHVRAVIRARDTATLSSKIGGQIINLPFREGEPFSRGDLLAEFNCKAQTAAIRAAQADHRAKAMAAATQQRLYRYEATGLLQFQEAQFLEESAAARVEELEAELSECQVFAPFSGRVLKQTKRPFELVKPGEAFLEITDQETLEIIAMVPSLILPQVSRQTRFTVRLDETGKDYQADVQRIGAGVDPLSRSVRIVSVFKERPAGVVPGMSGTAIFPAGR